MTRQQLSSKCTSLVQAKPIKALGVISKVALGGVLICLIIAFIFIFAKKIHSWHTFSFFVCKTVDPNISTNVMHSFGIGWLCFIVLMIFILTALPYYLIHLLTFKRIIMTPIMLALSVISFGIILGCLFTKWSTTVHEQDIRISVGIYIFTITLAGEKPTPSTLGIMSLIIVVVTFVTAFIPPRKKAK